MIQNTFTYIFSPTETLWFHVFKHFKKKIKLCSQLVCILTNNKHFRNENRLQFYYYWLLYLYNLITSKYSKITNTRVNLYRMVAVQFYRWKRFYALILMIMSTSNSFLNKKTSVKSGNCIRKLYFFLLKQMQ